MATKMSTPVDVVATEELERGLHPYLIGELVKQPRTLANEPRADGPRTQNIVATDSPVLLDFALPEEVRFLSRQKDRGEVIIEEAPSGPDWKQTFDEYRQSLGSMWLSGGLGGVPGGEWWSPARSEWSSICEGAGEASGPSTMPPSPQAVLLEEQLGSAHLLVRRALEHVAHSSCGHPLRFPAANRQPGGERE